MRKVHTVQTRLEDFDESPKKEHPRQSMISTIERSPKRPVHLWRKTMPDGEVWGVFEGDDTVLFVQIKNGRIHAHGREAVCKYCGGKLEIRGSQIFCGGKCGVFQGNFSYDLNSYLHWDGAKSLTLRKEIAKEEGLVLEERDLESIHYAPDWSRLYEYEEFDDEIEVE